VKESSGVPDSRARARQVVKVLVRHGFGHFLDRLNLEQVPGVGRVMVRLRRVPPGLSPLERIRLAMEELGPTFVKLGQLMASRPDMVGLEVSQAFGDLKDRVAPIRGRDALALVDRHLPGGTAAWFRSLEPEPAAAASIAQVHLGVFRDGSPVAVKIRRPGITQTVETDIAILSLLAHLAERYLPEVSVLEPVNLVNEFARSIREEMDFTREAANVERFATLFRGDPRVKVPAVFWRATVPSVLTVERLPEGIPVDRPDLLAAAGIDAGKTARCLVEVFLSQVLEHGYFHGDPHGGNLVVLGDGRIGFMDFGITGRLDEEVRQNLVNVFEALLTFDVDRMLREYLRMGVITEEVDIPAFRKDLKEFMRHYYGLPLEKLPVAEILNQSLQITLRHRIRIPSDLVLLGKSLMTLEGIVRQLDPALNILEIARPFALRLAAGRIRPRQMLSRVRQYTEDYLELVGTFPQQMGQILAKLIRGKLRIDLHHGNLENLIREMDRSANRISFALIISAVVVGSSLIITTDRGYKLLGFPVLGLAGYFFAAVLGIWLVVGILRSGRL
jgi:ubiquinone biosynthesis protein